MFDSLSTPADAAPVAPPAERATAGDRGFRADLAAEFRRLWRAPRDDLSILVVNGLMVVGCWFLLPAAARDWLFDRHGQLALAFLLQSWMLADTPSTNVLGNDVPGALAALPDHDRLRRLLRVKTTALALVVGVVSAIAAIVLGAAAHRFAAGMVTAVLLLVLPFGTAAVAQWLGILLPYRRHTARWRWSRRHSWWPNVRWILLVVAPYTAVPMISGVLIGAGALVPAGTRVRSHHVTGHSLLAGAAVACLTAMLVYLLATRAGAWMAVRRARSLQAYLSNPESG